MANATAAQILALAKQEKVDIDQLVQVATTQNAAVKDLQQKLTDALAANDTTAMQAAVDELTTHTTEMDAALAQVNPNPQPAP